MKLSYEKIWKFHFFVVFLYHIRKIKEQNKKKNNYYFMENTNLKKGDVIAINWGDIKMLAIFEKFDTTLGNQDGLYIYAEMNMRSKELYFKIDDCDFYYELRDITYRLADDNEKNMLYNAIGKHFTEEYDKDWYNHFTDSSYFDIQDYLFGVFRIEVRDYDDDLIYPDFINEIHIYIWDKLCKAMSVTDTDVNKPEMVNKQKFIEKACKVLDSMLYMSDCGDYDRVASFCNTVEDFIDEFKKYMEE